MNPRISVIGTGYLGATHAASMAELGFEVIGVDTDPRKVRLLSGGIAPFAEPGLGALLHKHVSTGLLRFTTDLAEAARFADVHFICVGTPQSRHGQAADLSAVDASVEALSRSLVQDAVIVGKSTVPVGTAERLATRIAALALPGLDVSLAWNPEFLREGHGVEDTLRPDRLVFGVTAPRAERVLREVYGQIIERGIPVHVTDLATAELAKVAANAFLATKVSFINAMAELSERSGADIAALADVLGDDRRIGRNFLDAGIGYGGGCLPKDLRGLAARAQELGAANVAALLDEVDATNLRARRRTVDLVTSLCAPTLRRRRVAVLGAAFKPLSDDVRDSPALHIAGELHRAGAEVRVYDPEATTNARAVQPALTYVASPRAALAAADVVLHLTEWPEFRDLDPEEVGQLVRTKVLVDGRNRLDAEWWRRAGWTVVGIGRDAWPKPATPIPATHVAASIAAVG
ncbi:UDP-glucose dehydrogenase family protein [Nocardioides sp.]|uniref:UDP-glucose dehydrogenase family protein n=1 Tax=Nocardioides sp. TaxID=35761 RepID=UPI003D102FA6